MSGPVTPFGCVATAGSSFDLVLIGAIREVTHAARKRLGAVPCLMIVRAGPPPGEATVSDSAGAKNTTESGGKVSGSDHGRPCAPTATATTPPRLPNPLPPSSRPSELASSAHRPPTGTPTE